ncbi:hypothetical protein LAWI1_G004435 [Lachnellula willkommii]|uniref:Uncharacterized protein n=1 Tax=Lachnellula willkommii TaxID=215461 RepID=A0A559MG26_9HELO|nr:hypothetical protein LAWI1_G004435 [Lachnellula willkommii]
MLDIPEMQARDKDWTGNDGEHKHEQRRALGEKRKWKRKKSMIYFTTEVPPTQRSSRSSPICINPQKRHRLISAQDLTSFLPLHPQTPLSPDHTLLTLLHFNLIRALTRITLLQGVDPDDMHLDIESPFHIHSAPSTRTSTSTNLSVSELPPNLRPTHMQLAVPHHPKVDVFPFPRFRDNVMVAGDGLDDVELCEDIVFGVDERAGERRGDCARSNAGGRTGLIVWGDPWFQSSWEVDQKFAKKYVGLFDGCEELLRRTNFWREERGESPLDMRQ